MTHRSRLILIHAVPLLLFSLATACGDDNSNDGGDEDTDGDSDSDSGADSDADTDPTAIPEPPEPDYEIPGTTYYVDAATGDDTNPGTSDSPFLTLGHALTMVTGGDAIALRNGEYGDLLFGAEDGAPIPEVFDDWVTIFNDEGHAPSLGTVELGIWNRNGYMLEFSESGNSDLRLRLDGLTIENGLSVNGSRYVEIRNCTVRQTGAIDELDQESGCLNLMNGQYLTIMDTEITHCAVGASLMTRDLVFTGNRIHHCIHDGIKLYGGERMLLEGNTIYHLDDGLTDDDPDPTGRNRHCDGIHMHTIIHAGGYDNPRWAGGATDVVIRGNLFYHIESMAVMINQNDWDGSWGDFVWENNLFAPSNGRLFILGSSFSRFVFRHNTVLFAPGDIWESHFGRTMGNTDDLSNPYSAWYHVQVWGNPAGNEFYNNILAAASGDLAQDEGIVTNNIIYSAADEVPHGAIPGSLSDFLDGGDLPGTLKEGSAAINTGTADYERHPTDIYGTARDATPDIGAVEYKEQ